MKQYTREPTAEIDCPSCKSKIRYYAFSGMGGMNPHFYCNTCSNVYFSEANRSSLLKNGSSEEFLEKLASELPHCPCGGLFQPGENPKCPHCKASLSHQGSALARLTDPYAILLDGSYVMGPENGS